MPDDFSIVEAFQTLTDLPGVLWLDSAVNGPDQMGRYSFLSADPVQRLRCDATQADGWTVMCRWLNEHLQHSIPATAVSHLPPFQGGIAGVWGYEAASWIESVGRAPCDDLPTPPISLGLYDWVIAWDHQQQRGWLISQGLPEIQWDRRLHRAVRRADQVMAWLDRRDVRPAAVWARRTADQLAAAYPTPYASLTSNFTGPAFQATVAEIVARIRRGDSFQVNIAQRLLYPQQQPAAELYLKLRTSNPAPLAGYYDGGDFQLLSSSPEGFLRLNNRQVETRPIKGTTPRTGDATRDAALAQQLSESEKDRAENVMIVDLMRNDLSRVCDDQSVRVEKLCEVEPYAFVQHLVSVVRGTLDPAATLGDLLTACFPGGSVTGAPKVEAMRTIAGLEPTPRGPYCGSLGYISCGGTADFNILIRTVTAAHGWLQFPVGGGITARSDPFAEEQETWHKAEGMLRAIVSR